jgi:sugar/nucleoside kinase (ribokinase family)
VALPFNFALHAAQAFLDAEIHLLSAVGEDVGPVFAARLDAVGIRHDLVRVVNTPSLGVRLDDKGERSFYDYDPGGLLDWEISESQRQTIETADLVVLTRFHGIAPLLQRLVRVPARGPRVVDFADISGTPMVDVDRVLADRDLADVCIFGISRREYALRDRLHTLSGDHGGPFVITLADEGAVAHWHGETYQHSAFRVAEVVDTSGAGDCFAAHFLSQWCVPKRLDEALGAGCLAASRIIGRRGAS